MPLPEFSVLLWFDNTYEYVARYITAEAAIEIAWKQINTKAAQKGLVTSVEITDGTDTTVFLWEHGITNELVA